MRWLFALLVLTACAPSVAGDRRIAQPPTPERPYFDIVMLGAGGTAIDVRIAIEAGMDVNVRNIHGYTPLLYAARYNRSRVVQLLVEAGADLEAQDYQGRTALMLALMRRDLQRTPVVQVLLAYGADPTAGDPAGESVLSLARQAGNPYLIQLIEDAIAGRHQP